MKNLRAIVLQFVLLVVGWIALAGILVDGYGGTVYRDAHPVSYYSIFALFSIIGFLIGMTVLDLLDSLWFNVDKLQVPQRLLE